ncbi:MAG: hypothetical protein ACUVXB_15005 [Bryobacteraceae bacterium]
MGYSTSYAGPSRLRWPVFYLALVFTTLATLLLELSLTRIFSVIFHYHFAFLAISIALFGLGAGGVFAYVVSGWRWNLYSKLGAISALNGVVVVFALAASLSVRDAAGFWTLAAVYFPSTLPFFLAGTVVSSAIAEAIDRVGRVYFFDLVGAGAGCLLLVPLLDAFGGPNTVLAAAVFYAAAAALWYSRAGQVAGRAVSVALALALLVLLGYNAKFRLIDVTYAKGKELSNESFVKWNSFSRVAVTAGQSLIVIDADASTGVASFDFDRLSPTERRRLLYEGPGLPYLLRPGAKTLILGAGGGWDVARALAGGSRDVTAVEINPIIAETLMRGRLREYSRGLYFRPEVRLEVAEGRSFVKRSREKYQVIQATLVDTWASTAAGAYALTENYLYTTNAFTDYLNHLSDDGILVFTRWGLDPPRESLRLLSLARAALQKVGEGEPWRHIAVARQGRLSDADGWGALDTVLIARKPLGEGEIARLRELAEEAGLELLYLPGAGIPNAFTALMTSQNPALFEDGYPYNIRAVSDDRPFFFYSVQSGDVARYLRYFLRGEQPKASRADFQVNLSVPVMLGLLAVSVAAVAVMLALPPVVLKAALPREPRLAAFLLFFVAIGAGYVLSEVALIQRFVLFLGHPTYALTVIIFAMLMASGWGSYVSRRVVSLSEFRLGVVMALAAGLLVALTAVAGTLTGKGVGWPQAWKVAFTVLLIAPPAFFMGMPFPAGLSLLEIRHKPTVKWAWAVNSAASVLGSVGAIFVAIYAGLQRTLAAGAACYIGALLLLVLTLKAERGTSSSAGGR